jgi:serine/threonine protein kinase
VSAENFVLGPLLGEGQSGRVFQATHRYLGREVAVKVIPIIATANIEELLDEGRKLASLPENPNVVRVWDAGTWDDHAAYIASELCTGGTIEHGSWSASDPAAACELVSRSCRGVQHLHANGLLHLDLRPANILIGSDGEPRVADFGLSQWRHKHEIVNFYWPHAAPELFELAAADERTDVFGAAMTLAHLLTDGSVCRPFPTGAQFLSACANGDWPAFSALPVNIPSKVKRLLRDATAYDPAARPQSVTEFRRRLDAATPRTSFRSDGPHNLCSVDGEWEIARRSKRHGEFAVEVRRRGRAQSRLSTDGLTDRQAEKRLQKLVDDFAAAA